MALTPDDIKSLVAAFDASDWGEMSVRIGDTTLELTRTGRPPLTSAGASDHAPAAPAAPAAPVSAAAGQPSPAPAASAVAAPTPGPATGPAAGTPDGHHVKAPSLGLFWRSPQPGAPPFVEIGQEVDSEETVGIVEVMKLMNHVKAGVSGTVVAIEPDNGQMVEFGQLLVVIRPNGQ